MFDLFSSIGSSCFTSIEPLDVFIVQHTIIAVILNSTVPTTRKLIALRESSTAEGQSERKHKSRIILLNSGEVHFERA